MCGKCLRSIAVNHSFECIGCKKNVPLGKTCYFCKGTNQVDQLLVVADYKDFKLAKALKLIKYRFINELIYPLLVLVKKYLKWLNTEKGFNIFQDRPLVIPIPLHRTRYNWRGFNQAELMAELIADNFQMSVCSDILYRSKKSKPQAEIQDREERLKNVNDIFYISDSEVIKDKTALLIDDVCTTGATLNEAARILKEKGVTKVMALVIARG